MILAWFSVVAFVTVGSIYVVVTTRPDPVTLAVGVDGVVADVRAGELRVDRPEERSIDPYRGYGTWVDVFDFSPPYSGVEPTLEADELQAMADAGVRTVYLQAARLDDRSPGGLEDRWLLAEWLLTPTASGSTWWPGTSPGSAPEPQTWTG